MVQEKKINKAFCFKKRDGLLQNIFEKLHNKPGVILTPKETFLPVRFKKKHK